MFEAKSMNRPHLARYRPLLALLVPLCLAPLASCAEDRYLAQNYQTGTPGYEQPSYTTQPPGYTTGVPNGSQFLAPPQLAELVARIALYPDDLIGIILPASTYPLQVVQAARYLDAVRSNSTLAPDDTWDNAVVALLNYPDVVNMMDRDLEWTERLGQAVMAQQADVIAAIGQFRAQAQAAGNLRSDGRQVVEVEQGAIRIRPANPQIIYVPQYEPAQVLVYQSRPVFGYYPRPYPVYYYNYSSDYPSGYTNFWGVSTLFTIGWSSRRVHLQDYDYYDDPRFDRPYNGHFYRRSHHDWHRDNPRWRDDDRHDDRDGHGRGKPPRERDWHPHDGKGNRPATLGPGRQGRNHDKDRGDDDRGGRGGRGDDDDRGGRGPGRGEPREGGGRNTVNVGPVPAPRRMQTQDVERERRTVRPVAPAQSAAPTARPGGTRDRQPREFDAPKPSSPMSTRRESGTQIERRQFESQTGTPPARFSAPTPSREERNLSPQRYAPIQAPPAAGSGLGNTRRDTVRAAPSRPEPRIVTPSRSETRVAPSRAEPRRQEMRAAPSRPEPRTPAASSRNSDGPAAIRRGGDEERSRR